MEFNIRKKDNIFDTNFLLNLITRFIYESKDIGLFYDNDFILNNVNKFLIASSVFLKSHKFEYPKGSTFVYL